jgi:peroxiredoxin Q/BCP
MKVFHEGAAKEVTLADLLTRRTIVSLYMKNNTPSCDRQNASLAAHAKALARAGYNVVAISRNTCASQARFAAANHLPHLLASDPDDNFARAAQALVEKTMYGRRFIGPARSAFVLERDGTILGVIEKVDAERHGEQLLELIAALEPDRTNSAKS